MKKWSKARIIIVVLILINLGYAYYLASQPNISGEEAKNIVVEAKGLNPESALEDWTTSPQWKFVEGTINRVYQVVYTDGTENFKVYISAKTGKIVLEEMKFDR